MVRFFILALTLFVFGCSAVGGRLDKANKIAASADMKYELVRADGFVLTTFNKINSPGAEVNIYIEGDGFAYAARDRVSANPTPRDPLALRLASKDTAENIIYIGRPCQYTDMKLNPRCERQFWSSNRFAPITVRSVNKAIEILKSKYGFSKINLIGYSGGAAIAVLVASGRNDVASIRTVAGNLDHKAVNTYHSVSQLDKASLNPVDYAGNVRNIPQYHFVGEDDNIIPPFIAKNFAMTLDDGNKCVKVSSVKNATHHSGWEEHWNYLLTKTPACSGITKN